MFRVCLQQPGREWLYLLAVAWILLAVAGFAVVCRLSVVMSHNECGVWNRTG